MTISVVPVAAPDPPVSPSAAMASRNGPSFGQFIDNADANAKAAGSPAGTRQSASSDGSRTNPAPSSATPPNQAAPSSSSQPQPASDKGSGKSTSTGRGSPGADDAQGKGAAGVRDQSTGDNASPRTDLAMVAALVAPTPVIAPTASPTGSNPTPAGSSSDKSQPRGVQSASADGKVSGLSPMIGSPSKGQVAWQSAASAANANGDSPAAPASAPALPAGGPQSDIPGAAKSTAANIAIPANAALTAAPSATSTPPVVGTASNRGTARVLSAQAAAALGHVSVAGAALPQAQPATAAAVPTGPAGAPLSGSTARSIIGATVASPSTPGAPSNDPGQVPTTDGAPGALEKPLPPVSGAVDLTAKFSATALPAHSDAAASAIKAKTDSHVTASATNGIANRPTTSPAGESAPAVGAAKQPEASPVGVAAGEPDVPGTDDAAAASTAATAAVDTQPRGDVVPVQNGGPAIARAQEATVAPVAALHSVADQVAVSLKRGVKAGNDQIQINLEPASLGKIAVRLEFAQDGRVTATFSADRPDTLTLLNHDSRALEQSLRDAGLRADSGSLTFNLSGGDNGASARQFGQSATYAATAATMADSDRLAPVVAGPAMSTGRGHDGSLDIHV